MELVDVLRATQDDVLTEASSALHRAHLTHYEASGDAESARHLEDLFGLVVGCLAHQTVGPIVGYAETIAKERFAAGFDIAEVQTAFNVLEEAIWHVVIAKMPPDVLVEAAGMVGHRSRHRQGHLGPHLGVSGRKPTCSFARPERAVRGHEWLRQGRILRWVGL